jgi:hypothetical protein
VPNWCHNTLVVSGNSSTVDAFVEHVKDENQPLTFEACAPTPEDVDSWVPEEPNTPLNRLFGGGWYGWRIRHWGTKWDANFTGPHGALVSDEANIEATVEAFGVQKGAGAAIYKFDTAWSPPSAWVEHAAHEHEDLNFVLRFAEAGAGFAGEVRYYQGILVIDKELRVDEVLMPEEMWF